MNEDKSNFEPKDSTDIEEVKNISESEDLESTDSSVSSIEESETTDTSEHSEASERSKNETEVEVETETDSETEDESETEDKSESETESKDELEAESKDEVENTDQNDSTDNVKAEEFTESKNEKKSQAKPGKNRFATFASLVAVALSGTALYYAYNRPTTSIFHNSNSASNNAATFAEGSISEIANSVSKSVVSIITNTSTTGSFFTGQVSQAAGTGFILSSDGYIATNKHVVANATKIGVILDDGSTYEDVELIGTDPINDFAIVKIKDVKDLTPIKIGDSKTTNIGQQVVAIGNALGTYQNSVTSGIISGKGRSLTASDSSRTTYETLSDMIQTDAAINGGNSGGPLVNAAGEVIGINTAYASQGNNVGFAIPINSVKGIMAGVLKDGKFERAVLGVRYQTITPLIAKEKKLDVTAGAYVKGSNNASAVIKGSAGDKAGIKDGDIITAVNGTKIGTAGSLGSLIGEYAVGDTVKLEVYRDKKYVQLDVKLEAYDADSAKVTTNKKSDDDEE
ncbi:trypsin-like peptidase domain-containing protein [Candidatus Saccharibacteria bacterium]|nr:trypsin-like peptidase domain-containing protein [Candidatus Saccharibacteria bacterium]